MLELVDTRNLRLDIQAPQRLYPAINTDMPVQIRLEAIPDRVLSGRVRAKVPVKDVTARTFLVRIDIDEPDNSLTAGMSAQASFSASILTNRGWYCHVTRLSDYRTVQLMSGQLTGMMTAIPVPSRLQIKFGKIMSDSVEIKSGLAAGQQIVLQGYEVLSDGQNVRIIEHN
ncbi:MAG: efflux RND transporter periplasmic adaptor subunit [Gammaproteobacteria bacterium]|nr:efflux RND transporter periplasmic adaptor subunit [Gammaproteobacteria bacterium]